MVGEIVTDLRGKSSDGETLNDTMFHIYENFVGTMKSKERKTNGKQGRRKLMNFCFVQQNLKTTFIVFLLLKTSKIRNRNTTASNYRQKRVYIYTETILRYTKVKFLMKKTFSLYVMY